MRHRAFQYLWLLLLLPSVGSADPYKPIRDITVRTGLDGSSLGVEYVSKGIYTRLVVDNHRQLIARLGKVYSWEQKGAGEMTDRQAIIPMVEVLTDPHHGQIAGAATIRGECAPTMPVLAAGQHSGGVLLVNENSLIWRPGSPIVMIIRTQIESGMVIRKRPLTIGFQKLLIVIPSEVHGVPRRLPTSLSSNGEVRGLYSGRVYTQDSVYWKIKVGPGFTQLELYPPHGYTRVPELHLSYTYRR